MTRSSCSELRVIKMAHGKKGNTKTGEALNISFGDDAKAKKGESLQEAFKKFRNERQVFCLYSRINYAALMFEQFVLELGYQ